MLQDLLAGSVPMSNMPRKPCVIVMGGPFLHGNLEDLRGAVERLGPGEIVAYVVRLDLPLLMRLLTFATLSYRLRRVERTMAQRDVTASGAYGVDPHLDAPVFVYQLNTRAADYADRNLRARGTAAPVRRFVAYCCGYDLSLGGVVLMGVKR